MSIYFDYLTKNGERFFPYTRVDGIFDVNGNPFTDWMATINIHNHDKRYASASHTHDTRYSLSSHSHEGYAKSGHTHNYAASSKAGGAANTALALDKPFSLNVTGCVSGSVSINGKDDVNLELGLNHIHEEYLKYKNSDIILGDYNNKNNILRLKSSDTSIVIKSLDDIHGGEILVTNADTDVCRLRAYKNVDGDNEVLLYMGENNTPIISIICDPANKTEPKVTINAHVTVNKLTDLSLI